MLCDNLETVLVLLGFGADPDLESWETMRYRFPTDSNVHIGRTWMASHSGSYGSRSRTYVKEICLYLNLLEGKLRQVGLKFILRND
jgi:hypothetical protein